MKIVKTYSKDNKQTTFNFNDMEAETIERIYPYLLTGNDIFVEEADITTAHSEDIDASFPYEVTDLQIRQKENDHNAYTIVGSKVRIDGPEMKITEIEGQVMEGLNFEYVEAFEKEGHMQKKSVKTIWYYEETKDNGVLVRNKTVPGSGTDITTFAVPEGFSIKQNPTEYLKPENGKVKIIGIKQ